MKRIIPSLILIIVLLCACDSVNVQNDDASDKQQTAPSTSIPEFSSSDADTESLSANETDLYDPVMDTDNEYDEIKESFIQELMKADPNYTEAEVREGVDEIYEHVTKGEVVSFGPFSYQEPLYYMKDASENDRVQSILYTYMMNTDYEFELQLSKKTMLLPAMLSAVENADKSELIKIFPEASQWEIVFYDVGEIKGMECVSSDEVSFVFVDENYCITVEGILPDNPILQDIRDLFQSIH